MNAGGDDGDLLQEEASSYLISVSDLMSGLLFIFLLTLVAFIVNFQDATDKQETARELAISNERLAKLERDQAQIERDRLRTVRDDLTNARRMRSEMLEDLRHRLDALGIRVEVDHDNGVLRLTENAVAFATARADLVVSEREKLSKIGSALLGVLPCYSGHPPPECPSQKAGKLEAVFIEGHTDNRPLASAGSGPVRDNWELSAERAIYTYRQLTQDRAGLGGLTNALGQPLFSVSGYGEGRPVVPHREPTDEPRNRRIDLRFIMSPPPASADVEPVRELKDLGVQCHAWSARRLGPIHARKHYGSIGRTEIFTRSLRARCGDPARSSAKETGGG